MGFKRTSEGRVFFQGAETSANDERKQPPRQDHGYSQQTQLQIVALLKSLNERLKTTQAERNKMHKELERYRTVIEDLENKAGRAERAYFDLEDRLNKKDTGSASAEKLAQETFRELEETRKLLLDIEDKAERADKGVLSIKSEIGHTKRINTEIAKKQAALNKQQQEQAQRLAVTEEKQSELTGKVEETASQQSRLVRKIDKAVEDRARFMRKIERIEETVIQTRDSLNAKAMVLLTDQGVAEAELEDAIPADAQAAEALAARKKLRQDEEQSAPIWRRSLRVQPLHGAVALVVILLAGWGISEIQKPPLPEVDIFENREFAASEIGEPVLHSGQAASKEQTDWSIEEDTSAFSPAQPVQSQEAASLPADDIGTLDLQDEAALVELLQENPDALAAELNKIEPSLSAIESMIEDTAPQEDSAATGQLASLTPQDKAETPAKSAPPVAQKVQPEEKLPPLKPGGNPRDLISADSKLPDVVKKIEAQAFEGIAEAQHDLAAIYTAGHGGVKQDYERAAFWFEQSARQGVANASYNLGVLYHQNLGVKGGVAEAIEWYKRAAQQGHPEAQYNLGIAYIEGIGVPYNPAAASSNFESAAESGIMEAAYNLGLIHENGLLGQAKPDEALMWYKTAADQGSPEARAALEQLAKTLEISLEDVNRLAESMKAVKQKQTAVELPKKTDKKVEAAPAPAPTPAPAEQKKQAAAPPLTPEPEQEFAVRKQGEEQILAAQIQEYLMRAGLYPGPADGVEGPLTSDAIRSYQTYNNLHVDGRISKDLLSHMLSGGEGDDLLDAAPGEVGSREE